MKKNLYCNASDLKNEASVEAFFVSRFLSDLGYSDSQVKPKTSLDALPVNRGSRSLKFKPDYAIVVGGKVGWIVEAKSPSEALANHVPQCAGYCLALNRQDADRPVEFFLLTNGIATELYAWDRGEPLLTLTFNDFASGNAKFERLRALLGADTFTRRARTAIAALHVLYRRKIHEVNADFAWCHQFIHRKDALSQSAAFLEFVKLVFLKLMSDRDVRNKHPELADEPKIEVPADAVRFSTRWLDARKDDAPSPLDALQFQEMLKSLEKDIKEGKRKRIFNVNDTLALRPDTIRGVVARLEHTDLYSIDADLNGRLFETFLNATMRGKDLGQFFTPRSVVKVAIRLARIEVRRDHIDTVLDACCGTGGFLIDALADMWQKTAANKSLSGKEQEQFKRTIATERIIGIDMAAEPPLARIARMNMYLHGDGGSRLYQADALDKRMRSEKSDSPELAAEKAELGRMMSEGGFADVVLTNPPFAKEYNRREGEGPILDAYETAFVTDGGARRPRPGLKSSIMFLERYYDMLRPGGRMITVIDDSILGGRDYRYVRDFIRSRFIVRAVVSLAGDAFQRSNARVKTSLLYLVKRTHEDDEQPPVFMHYSTVIGLDDPARQRVLPIDRVNREKAQHEVAEIGSLFDAFMAGDGAAKKWIVPASAIRDRMDVKHCLLRPGRLVKTWQSSAGSGLLRDLVDVRWPSSDAASDASDETEDVIETEVTESDSDVRYLRVRYDGFAEAGEERVNDAERTEQVFKVQKDDIVISHINAVHGAVAVVPPSLEGCVVTNEFTVCRAKPGIDPRVVWSLLRSPEARSDLLILATGIGRTRVKPDQTLRLDVPKVPSEAAAPLVAALQEAERLEEEAKNLRQKAQREFESRFKLSNEKAEEIIAAFKPPK